MSNTPNLDAEQQQLQMSTSGTTPVTKEQESKSTGALKVQEYKYSTDTNTSLWWFVLIFSLCQFFFILSIHFASVIVFKCNVSKSIRCLSHFIILPVWKVMNLLKSEKRMSRGGVKDAWKMAVLDSTQLIMWRTFSDQRGNEKSGEEKADREKKRGVAIFWCWKVAHYFPLVVEAGPTAAIIQKRLFTLIFL